MSESTEPDSIPLYEEIRAGVLTHLAPDAVQTHLYMNETTHRSYADVRRVVVDYIEAQRSARPDGGPVPVAGSVRNILIGTGVGVIVK